MFPAFAPFAAFSGQGLCLHGVRGLVLFICIGALAVLGQAPYFLWPVTIICLAVLKIGLDVSARQSCPLRAGFGRGFAFGLGYFLAGLYWVGSAFIARGPEFVPFMPVAILALCGGLAIFWGLAGLVYVWLVKNRPQGVCGAVVFACVFALAEFARGTVFGGFPWNLPGYIFAAGKPVSQIASAVGIYGLNVLVLFLAAGLGLMMQTPRRWGILLGAGLVLSWCYGYGWLRLRHADIKYVEGVRLRIVHASIPQKDKFDPNKYVQNIDTYLRLTTSPGFDKVTHVIWPEGAVPGLMLQDKGLMRVLTQVFTDAHPRPPVLITQTLRAVSGAGAEKPLYYNSATALTFKPGHSPLISPFYDKQKLVPFGEFIPAHKLLEHAGFKSLSTALESMTPGKSGMTPLLPGLPPGRIQICYEIIFPGFNEKSRPVDGRAARFILNLSNDAWYGNSSGPRQHVNQARYRAIEEGLPVVRATSGGISGVIDPYGRQLSALGIGQEGVLDGRLPEPISNSGYNYSINYKIHLIIVLILIGCGMVIRKGLR